MTSTQSAGKCEGCLINKLQNGAVKPVDCCLEHTIACVGVPE